MGGRPINVTDIPSGTIAAVEYAAASKCLCGESRAGTWPTQRSREEKLRTGEMEGPERRPAPGGLVPGEEVVFAATGVTPGEVSNRVRYFRGGARTHTVVMSTEPRMVRSTDTIHALEPDAGRRGFQL